MKVVTPSQMKNIDERCWLDYYMPGLLLMEHAGTGLFDKAAEYFSQEKCRRAAVVCGKGNNGGDGLVAARHFINSGAETVVFVCAQESDLKGDCRSNYDILKAIGADIVHLGSNNLDYLEDYIKNADLVIDALLGTGVSGNVEGFYADVINIINASGKYIVSADIPSGIDGLTGKVCNVAVRASLTVTFGLPKTGNLVYPGREYCGELIVFDIGIPRTLLRKIDINLFQTDAVMIAPLLQPRPADSNKGNYGRVGIITGSAGMTGAGLLASRAALRAGAGLVYNIVPGGLAGIYESASVETITVPAGDREYFTGLNIDDVLDVCDKMDSVLIGPGLGRNPETGQFVQELLKAFDSLSDSHRKTLIIDADALNLISNSVYILNDIASPAIITPHPGEMARLTDMTVPEIQERRIKIARDFAREFGKVVVLKGAATITAEPGGKTYINPTGNPGMATAGSGDVLAGIIAALSAGGIPAELSAFGGAFIHGLCGDMARDKFGEKSLIAGDITDMIPCVFQSLQKRAL